MIFLLYNNYTNILFTMKHFILFLSFINFSLSLIEIPLMRKQDFQFRISQTLSNDYYFVKPSLQSPFSYLHESNSKNNSFAKKEICIASNCTQGLLYTNELNLNEYNVKLDYIGFFQTKPQIDADHLSFALNPMNTSMSIMHQLYNSHQIESMVFSIGAVTENSDYIFIGGVPSNVYYKNPHGECAVTGDSWGCELNQVYFEDVVDSHGRTEVRFNYQKRYRAIFSTEIQEIQVPKEYYEFVKETMFKRLIEEGKCKEWITNRRIECQYGKILLDALPSFVNFVFDNVTLAVHKSNLVNNKELLLEAVDESRYAPDEWVFGSKFLELFFTSFDYNNKKIGFYIYSQGVSRLILGYKNIKEILCLAVIFELCVGFIIILSKIKKIEFEKN